MTISIEQAQLKLAELIEKSSQGERISITRDGQAVAQLVPVAQLPDRKPGTLKGKIHFLAGEDDKSHLADFKEYME
jgi:prevent-host-death family protein